MKEFAHDHPWMTFFLGLAAIGLVRDLVVPAPVVVTPASPTPAAVPKPSPAAQVASGILGPNMFTPYMQPSIRPGHG